MAELRIVINQSSSLVTFAGSGTFLARDRIKELGSARWNPVDKTWELKSCSLGKEELSRMFPGALVEVYGGEISQEGVLTCPLEREGCKGEVNNAVLPESLSVAQLTNRLRGVLQTAFPGTICVHGVLSSVKEMSNGRVFLDLAEADRPEERISCVIWRDAEKVCAPLIAAGFSLQNDLQVMFKVQLDLSRRCSISLQIVGVVPEYTIAKLAAKREQTNERLKSEGIFAKNRQLVLPFLPRRLGLLTSAGGTVINDFRAALDSAKFGFELFWVDTKVQGSEAKAALLKGLKVLENMPGLDAILIFRGGGSAGDLAVFNEYDVARAVCLCNVPVVSAIGHQEDNSSVQDVSCIALGVPKDIGRFFADIIISRRNGLSLAVKQIKEVTGNQSLLQQHKISGLAGSICALARHYLEKREELLMRSSAGILVMAEMFVQRKLEFLKVVASPVIAMSEQSLQGCLKQLSALTGSISAKVNLQLRYQRELVSGLSNGILNLGTLIVSRAHEKLQISNALFQSSSLLVERKNEAVSNAALLIEELSPEKQLARGFALVIHPKSGSYIRRAAELTCGDEVNLQFSDGYRQAKVIDLLNNGGKDE